MNILARLQKPCFMLKLKISQTKHFVNCLYSNGVKNFTQTQQYDFSSPQACNISIYKT